MSYGLFSRLRPSVGRDSALLLDCLQSDADAFHGMMDEVLAGRGQYDYIIDDGKRGYFPSSFVDGILGRLATKSDTAQPRLVHLANSSQFARYQPHQEALRNTIAGMVSSGQRVLIVTEYVESGKGLASLADKIRGQHPGVSVDIAALAVSPPKDRTSMEQHISDITPSGTRLFIGNRPAGPGDYVLPNLMSSTIAGESIGMQSVAGKAELQPYPKHRPAYYDPEIFDTAPKAVSAIVDDYLSSRGLD